MSSPKIEVRDAELCEPFADRLVRGAGQPHVLADRQVRHQGGILIDGDDAGLARLRRGAERLALALDEDLPAVAGNTPVMIFTSVLLPAPLAPISP